MPSSFSLTTVILTKNSVNEVEELLGQATTHSESVLLLDDFSEDDIQGLAKKCKAHLFQHALEEDFAAHRNSVFSHISTDWVLFLDADELPSVEFWRELEESIATDKYEAFNICRSNQFLGRQLRFGEAGEKKLLRLAKATVGKNRWKRAVHEVWEVENNKVGTLQSRVLHRQPRSLKEFIAKLNHYAVLEQSVRPELSAFQCGLQFALFPPGKFIWNVIVKQAWRDGFAGLALAWLMSYYSAIVRIQQYEKTL